jgi:hypothetical protein
MRRRDFQSILDFLVRLILVAINPPLLPIAPPPRSGCCAPAT